jgi:hypothetical protein
MKKLHIIQYLSTSFSYQKKNYIIINNSYSFNESIFVFDLFELSKAFYEKLLIVFSNIRL